ncbi:SH3 domain-containing protein [uncultured Hyphomicrobium sp.]|uniref:SH3 domain-containing protein n=1 Tax=uncultured Hyphomicrobium sp. TaxID=194373 RepID=UPI0025D56A29|nr:SH3 domain-containing protein [uncultured Hyphomicrobium sp.]
MKKLRLIGAFAGLTLMSITAAHAAPGFSTANVNVRTGPDTDFPSVGVIPEGDEVEITGCLRDESWCDVIWAGNRGWVYSEYLAFEQRGEYVRLPDVGPAVFRIPFVTFTARDYWDRHYVGRPWYSDRGRWYSYKVRPRPGWRAPPPGARRAGWWRSGYHAPQGMALPPDRWRRMERRHERREDRRDWREERRDDRREWRQDRR